jgi:hypothetical protein
VVVWQGRGFLYWAIKSDIAYIKKDLLVRGIKLGPISYRRRPSTSCRPAYAGSLGYTTTIAGLEYFMHEIPRITLDVKKVRTLPLMSLLVRSTRGTGSEA